MSLTNQPPRYALLLAEVTFHTPLRARLSLPCSVRARRTPAGSTGVKEPQASSLLLLEFLDLLLQFLGFLFQALVVGFECRRDEGNRAI